MTREKVYKKCPRCGEKTFAHATVCDNCKLIFARMEYATNKAAKKAIFEGNRSAVLKTSSFPKDLNRWKMFFICLFGGVVGAHNLYAGRYFKGFFSLIGIIVLAGLLLLMPSSQLAQLFSSWLFIPYAIITIMWFWDLLMLGLNKYKVPVALEIKGKEVENERK